MKISYDVPGKYKCGCGFLLSDPSWWFHFWIGDTGIYSGIRILGLTIRF